MSSTDTMAELQGNDEAINHLKRSFTEEKPAAATAAAAVASTGDFEENINRNSDVDVTTNDAVEPASKRVKVELSEDQNQEEAAPKQSANGSLKVESPSVVESKPRVKGLAPVKSE